MAKKIIVLERINAPSDLTFRVAYWLDVPAARQPYYANAAAISEYKNATGPELAALTSGAVLEQVETVFYPAGTPIGTMTANLQTRLTALQTAVTNNNALVRYGSFYDGTSWTLVGMT